MLLHAPAKINLALDILGRRQDGYHFIDTVMQAVDLCDEVELALTGGGIEVECLGMKLPAGEGNTAYRAARLFFERTGLKSGVKIRIDKRIPAGAGLAGGSADAAAVLVGLNALLQAGLTVRELCEIGVKVGADVPFCILGGTARIGGIGEKLTPLPALCGCWFVVVKPAVSVSTAEAYRAFDEKGSKGKGDIDAVVRAVAKGDIESIGSLAFNAFEDVIELEDVMRAKEELLSRGALGAAMSGSGSAVFGIFDEKGAAERACFGLKESFEEVFLTSPHEGGPFIVRK